MCELISNVERNVPPGKRPYKFIHTIKLKNPVQLNYVVCSVTLKKDGTVLKYSFYDSMINYHRQQLKSLTKVN